MVAGEEERRLLRIHLSKIYEEQYEETEECHVFYARLPTSEANGATVPPTAPLGVALGEATHAAPQQEGGPLSLVGTFDVHLDARRGTCHLFNFCVAAPARRRGVARAMVQAAAAAARRLGAARVQVETMAANEAAIFAYTSCGFRVSHIESKDDAHKRGQCLDGLTGEARIATLLMDLDA